MPRPTAVTAAPRSTHHASSARGDTQAARAERPAGHSRAALAAGARLAALLAGLLSCVALEGCSGASDQSAQVAAPAAAVTIEPTTLDMGDLVPEVPVTKQVRITNNTAAPITVSRAVADCSCTDPSWPDEPIGPGQTVETDITMTPGLKQGVTLTKRVTFDIEGGEPVFLSVVGRVGLFVEYAPDFLEGPADDATSPAPAEIMLKSADGTAFAITSIDPAVGKAKGEPAAAREHAVEVDWTKWRELGKPMKLTITTDHPSAPPLVTIIRRPVPPPPTTPPAQ